ncbi:NADP-dependent 3-hydroxy acid dehydrogenase YdfG [Pleomorphomonas sp. T1.2MG-36]|uniref:SDR family oxidoreductase n=1 Tax=Pleomorphomonas sp. T1.2MG-36 TaxID=3041167 RepID=UPI00247759E4|nr:SDR family oxidoreductase [Pleomorphomonas sp. T1.2MG-36]CAI9403939.1 NADP-dependent 3-hydroxy acid dehydrogenase YdfG [Pleomorphomonas sp. T1.2MG-36]
MTTVLITGCSSGFGLETARLFLERGWSVVATMREPRADILPASERLKVLPLDVTDAGSIAACLEAAGPVDVLVNNAGVGLLNALEGIPMEAARRVFETNTLGTIAMAKAVLPQFRQRKAGVIVNVTSTVTAAPLHLLSVYTASKAAVNAFTECLALEVEPLGVRARIVLPGRAPETAFGQNHRKHMPFGIPEAYSEIAEGVFAEWRTYPADQVTHAGDVAEAVWRAATDPSCPMRLPAGVDAVASMEGAERVMA